MKSGIFPDPYPPIQGILTQPLKSNCLSLLAGGERAIGHGGANIGTAAYMIDLPERRVSIVVMINAFNNKCLNDITEEWIDITVKHLSSRKAR